MPKKIIKLAAVCFVGLFFCFMAKNENPLFKIDEKDVAFVVPQKFPKPYYNFKNNKITPAGFVLGRRLFNDPILSKDNSVSCATCHERLAAFAHIDHKLSHGIYAKIGTRNVPALQNLVWKDSYMWDGGVNNLEVQPINPITNPIEMDETLANVVSKLRRDSTYRVLFQQAFNDTLINSERLLKSLAQFTGLMISGNSRYDRYITGKDTFSLSEKRGLKLFRLKCAACHSEPLFTNNSYRNNGLKPDTSLNDIGRGKVTGNAKDNYTFKVPSLRNVEVTYPYMHDGRFKKLNDVLLHYTKTNDLGLGADALIRKIGPLSKNEKDDLFAFLLTLTDRDFIYDRRFLNPFWNYN